MGAHPRGLNPSIYCVGSRSVRRRKAGNCLPYEVMRLGRQDNRKGRLGDDLLRRVLLPWHVLILLDAKRHTSSRTTSLGADQLVAPADFGSLANCIASARVASSPM